MKRVTQNKQTLMKLIFVTATIIAFTGCAVLNPEPLETYNTSKTNKQNVCGKTLGKPNDIKLAKKCAELAIAKYADDQYAAGKWGIGDDVVLFTLGVGTGASALFGGSTDLTHGLILATATGTGIRKYVSAPQATKIYQSGTNADICILGEINTIEHAYKFSKGTRTDQTFNRLFRQVKMVSGNPFPKAVQLGKQATYIYNHLATKSVEELISVDQSVRLQIVTGRPSIDSIVTAIEKKATNTANANNAQQQAKNQIITSGLPKHVYTPATAAQMFELATGSSQPYCETRVKACAKDLTDLATSIKKDQATLEQCKIKATST